MFAQGVAASKKKKQKKLKRTIKNMQKRERKADGAAFWKAYLVCVCVCVCVCERERERERERAGVTYGLNTK